MISEQSILQMLPAIQVPALRSCTQDAGDELIKAVLSVKSLFTSDSDVNKNLPSFLMRLQKRIQTIKPQYLDDLEREINEQKMSNLCMCVMNQSQQFQIQSACARFLQKLLSDPEPHKLLVSCKLAPVQFSTKSISEKARLIMTQPPGEPWYFLTLPSFLALLNIFTNPETAKDFSNMSIFLDDPLNPRAREEQQVQKLTFQNATVKKLEFEQPKPKTYLDQPSQNFQAKSNLRQKMQERIQQYHVDKQELSSTFNKENGNQIGNQLDKQIGKHSNQKQEIEIMEFSLKEPKNKFLRETVEEEPEPEKPAAKTRIRGDDHEMQSSQINTQLPPPKIIYANKNVSEQETPIPINAESFRSLNPLVAEAIELTHYLEEKEQDRFIETKLELVKQHAALSKLKQKLKTAMLNFTPGINLVYVQKMQQLKKLQGTVKIVKQKIGQIRMQLQMPTPTPGNLQNVQQFVLDEQRQLKMELEEELQNVKKMVNLKIRFKQNESKKLNYK